MTGTACDPFAAIEVTEWRRSRAPARRGARNWRPPLLWRLPGGERLYRLRLNGRHPLRLLGSPEAVVLGDSVRGAGWLEGRPEGATPGTSGRLDLDDPWRTVGDLSPEVAVALARFDWLLDIAALPDAVRARPLIERWMKAWLARYGRWGGPGAWRPDWTAARLKAWFTCAPLILSSADLVYRSAVIDSMARQARHLHQQLDRVLAAAIPRPEQASVVVALGMAGLLLPYGEAWRRAALDALDELLAAALDTDAAPRSRRAGDALALIAELALLANTFSERGEEVPRRLLRTLEGLAAFVRLLRHEDGRLGHFQSAGNERASEVERVLKAARSSLRPAGRAARGGYHRLKARRSLLIVDLGPPPPIGDGRAHAAPLAFEFADGAQRIIVNLGPLEAAGPTLGRTTAAHSTLVVGDRNACEVRADGLGPGLDQLTAFAGEGEEGWLVGGHHDGYRRRFGLRHERRLLLARDGTRLEGEDALLAADRAAARGNGAGHAFAIRFHLHPEIEAAETRGGESVLLKTPSGRLWRFRLEGLEGALDLVLRIEGSLYDGAGELRPTRQVVVEGRVAAPPLRCRWTLTRLEG